MLNSKQLLLDSSSSEAQLSRLDIVDQNEKSTIDLSTKTSESNIYSSAEIPVKSEPFGFQDLPSEIIQEIFSLATDNYSNIRLTSLKFKLEIDDCIINELNKEKVTLSNLGCNKASKAVEYIIQNKLKTADLFSFDDTTDNDLKKLTDNCKDINKLTFSTIVLFPEYGLAEAIGKLTNLQNLTLMFPYSYFSGDVLAEALGKLTNLQSLNLNWCVNLRSDTLIETLSKLTNLQSIKLAWCKELSGNKLSEALSKLTKLQHLNLIGCTQLSEDKLTELLGKLTNLKDLNLAECTQLCEDKLVEAFGQLTNLQSLNLARCKQFSGDKLSEALGKLIKLQHLNLIGCTQLSEDNLTDMLSKLNNLRSINLDRYNQLSEDQLNKLKQAFPLVKIDHNFS